MMFQIQYERDAERHTTEVEAHSPCEAVVKFESVQRGLGETQDNRVRVTSVVATAEDIADDLAEDLAADLDW